MPPDSRAPESTATTPGGRGPTPAGNPASRLHECPRTGCGEQIRYDRLMCRADWYAVPKELRDEVWRTWNHGRGAGSPEHTDATNAAVAALGPKRAVA